MDSTIDSQSEEYSFPPSSSSLPPTPSTLRGRLDEEVPSLISKQKQTKVFLNVGGMTCAACSGTIERGLNSTDGVFSCKVSLLTESAEVLYDSTVISEEQVVEEIEDLGFDASVKVVSKACFIIFWSYQYLTPSFPEFSFPHDMVRAEPCLIPYSTFS